MNKCHRVNKCLFILITFILVVSLLLPGCGGGVVEEEEEMTADEGGTLVIPPPPQVSNIPEGTPLGWESVYTEIYFSDFESDKAGLRIDADITTSEAIESGRSVKLSNWLGIETDPSVLPLSPDTCYIFEFDYNLLDISEERGVIYINIFPEGSTSDEESVCCYSMLPNTDRQGTFSSGGMTPSDSHNYYMTIHPAEGTTIIIDNLVIIRRDVLPITDQPDRWAKLSELPFPRLGNAQQGNPNSLAPTGHGTVLSLREGDYAYREEEIEERLAFSDVIACLGVDSQTSAPAFVYRLHELNPDIVLLPYKEYQTQNFEKLRPPNATIDPDIQFLDGMSEEWMVRRVNGEMVPSSWPGFFVANICDDYCPIVNGQTYNDYFIDYVKNNVMASGCWDGIFLDTFVARVSADAGPDNPSTVDFDINNNGQRDETPAQISDMSRAAAISVLQELRDAVGNNELIMPNEGFNPELCLAPYVNGFLFEGWNEAWFYDGQLQPDEGQWRLSLDQYFYTQEATRTPHINILSGYGGENHVAGPSRDYLEPTSRDIEMHRFCLGTTLLEDGFYDYDLYDCRGAPFWFDEFSVDSEGTAIEDIRYKGYLGMPLGDAIELASPETIIAWADFNDGAVPAGVNVDPEVSISQGKMIIDNPDHTNYHESVKVTVNDVPFESGKTYIIDFDWEIMETLDDFFSVYLQGTSGILGSYRLPEVIAGESGTVHFPVTLNYGSNFVLNLVLCSGGGKVSIDNFSIKEGGAGPWRRDFENGLVLVNPLNTAYTFTTDELAGDFNRTGIKRILGTQAPEVNNGQPVTGTLTLQPFDAIILLADHISSR